MLPVGPRGAQLRHVLLQEPGRADPRKVPGLVGWWDARYLDLADGTPVGTWPDLSGNGRDMVQSTTGKKPTFTSNHNGAPALWFDGSDDYMNCTDTEIGRHAPLTCLARVERYSAAAAHNIIAKYVLNVSPWRNWRYYISSAGDYVAVHIPASGAWVGTAPQPWPGGEHVAAFRLDATYRFGAILDAMELAVRNNPDEYGALGNVRISHSSSSFHGWMRWVALYDRDLTQPELEYLNNV